MTGTKKKCKFSEKMVYSPLLDEEKNDEILCLKKLGINFTDISLMRGILIMTIWGIGK